MNALLTGASGLIGHALQAQLTNPILTSRHPDRLASNQVMSWPLNGRSGQPSRHLDVIFHLAGEPVAGGRWTSTRMDRIRNSRVDGTRGLVDWIETLHKRPKVLVCASAIGVYGDRGDEVLSEESTAGVGFLADVCRDWEAEARRAETLGVRVVCARLGMVLSPHGGALSKMAQPFKFGVGGPIGSGTQWMSWIHVDDVVGLLLHGVEQPISGPINLVAPNPLTNEHFTRELSNAVGRPAFVRAPRFIIRAALGQMSDIVLASQRVRPQVASDTGYEFIYPTADQALNDCFPRGAS
jgi:uncharacterized protein (TIGR01777 family)